MAENNFEYQTDTHLAKKYNDVLYDCMMRCNTSGFVNNATPHYTNLLTYYGAVNILFINTFVLFEIVSHNVPEPDGKNISVSEKLQKWSDEVESEISAMKTNVSLQNDSNFQATFEKCKRIHKLIMYGLQKRNMLVRMSQAEPRGKDSINYWDTKTGFKKGHVKGDSEMARRPTASWGMSK
jgi:hypothetical protein